ncbi:MAG: hypothetical protein E6Q24_07025 [Chitinophagaceae bacterium]|nr:MAG: hypothetical protein E6Q24_07025 [Chitinophagaceae bacterium]
MIPNPTRPDYYWENQYYLDEEKAEREAREKANKSTAKHTTQWLTLLLKLLFGAFLWTSGLLIAYFILKGSNSFVQLPIWQKVALLIGGAYLFNCVIFFLKGIMVALKLSGRKSWLLLWIINSCLICLPPAILVYLIVENLLISTKATDNPGAWSFSAGVLSAFIVYSKMGLNTSRTPKIFHWIFRMGCRIVR